MPGYLSNRYIKYDPSAEVAVVQATVSAVDVRLVAAEASIDDLSLNIGV
jgi:hypothetical protein